MGRLVSVDGWYDRACDRAGVLGRLAGAQVLAILTVLISALSTLGCDKKSTESGPAQAAWTGEQTGAAKSLCEGRRELLPEIPQEVVPSLCSCLVSRASSRWTYSESGDDWKTRLEILRGEGAVTSCRVEPLYGLWESPCYKLPENSLGARTRWEIKPDTVVVSHLTYADDTCKALGRRVTETYRGGARLEGDGDFHVDLYRTNAVQKYGDVGWSLVAGLAAEYDHKDWPVWRDLDISDRQRKKGDMPEYPMYERRYDRFRVVGDRLFVGLRTEATGNGKTSEKRPKEVFPDVYHQKKIEGDKGPEALAAGNGPVERDLGGSNRWRPSVTDPDGDDLTIECAGGTCPDGVRVENNEVVFDAGRAGKTALTLVVRDGGGRTATVATDITVFKTFTAYVNADGDGRGEGPAVTLRLPQADLPATHAAGGGDCAPGNPAKWQTAYRDMDGDGYTYAQGGRLCVGAAVPAGYTTAEKGDDCSDRDPTRWRALPYAHRDMDGDGYTVPTAPGTLCVGEGLPQGYLAEETGPDCDDGDPARKYLVAHYYLDRDGNGLGVPGPGIACTGDTTPYLPYHPRAPDPAEHHPASLAAGWYHTCLLQDSGGVKCWGYNSSGQIGNGTTMDSPTPAAVTADLPPDVVQLSTGGEHTCALTDTGAVKCWGDNNYGQLGDGPATDQSAPTQLAGLSSGAISVATGWGHTCVLLTTGGVKCWGHNGNGRLGDGTTTDRYYPASVLGLTYGVSSLSAGGAHTCAVMQTGAVKCWGYNFNGQLGDGTTTQRSTPTQVTGLTTGVSAVAAGDSHTCALLTTGGVKCWGANTQGQLGDGTTTQRNTPTEVSGLSSGVVGIATGHSHSCALLSAGGVKCWGYNSSGALGDGTTSQRNTPTDVSGLSSGVVGIATGGSHSCALLTTGGVKCWGSNGSGQLGDGTTTQRVVPTDVGGL